LKGESLKVENKKLLLAGLGVKKLLFTLGRFEKKLPTNCCK